MAVDQSGDDVGQVGLGLDGGELAAFDQGGEDRRTPPPRAALLRGSLDGMLRS